jgi:predicted lipoprotein with Yx(FWY)xxD motif
VRRSSAFLIVPLALLAGACGSSSSSTSTKSTAAAAPTTSTTTPATATVALTTRTLPGVGAVLVNGQGRTLYVFVPDHAKKVTCVGGCASVWPPLAISSGQKPAVSGGVQASLVSSDPDPSGGNVVTYGGWPLYLYVADPTAGTDHGQGVNSSGGLWYVIGASGKVVKSGSSAVAGGGSSTTTGGGGYSSGGSGY